MGRIPSSNAGPQGPTYLTKGPPVISGMPTALATTSSSASGAAMFASVVAGIHPTIEKAMNLMGQGFDRKY